MSPDLARGATAHTADGTHTIGVLGASGAVGRAAVDELRALGHHRLRLGGRHPEPLREIAAAARDGMTTVLSADAGDPASLAAFADGCTVVLNCAGPTYRLRATVATAALAAGAHCVDVAGDDPAMEDLAASGPLPPGLGVVLSSGTLPGLSSLLPRLLARGLDSSIALTAYCGGLEPCTPTVATDLVLSLTTGGADGAAYGEPLAAWRSGARQPRALRTAEDTEAPGFPRGVALQPFLGAETERLAHDLGLDTADWFNVHPGPRVRAVLGGLPARMADGADAAELEAALMQAARLDMAGHTPYYAMDFALEGTRAGRPVRRRLTLRVASSYRLTAAVGALAADALVGGRVPPGVHFACDVLDPGTVADRVGKAPGTERLDLLEEEPGQAAQSSAEQEEGVL